MCFHSEGVGSILGQRTRIPHAVHMAKKRGEIGCKIYGNSLFYLHSSFVHLKLLKNKQVYFFLSQ